MIINPYAINTANPNAHRYWRVNGITLASGSIFEISEIQLWLNGSRADAGAVFTTNPAPTFNPAGEIVDDDLMSRCYWNPLDPGTTLQWDLGGPVEIDAIRLGGYDTSSRYPSGLTLEYSDNGTDWTTKATLSGLTYPGNYTMSAEIPV